MLMQNMYHIDIILYTEVMRGHSAGTSPEEALVNFLDSIGNMLYGRGVKMGKKLDLYKLPPITDKPYAVVRLYGKDCLISSDAYWLVIADRSTMR